MAWTIEIGTYILDTADVASTSTTTDLVLGFNPAPDSVFAPSISGDSFAWPDFWVFLSAPDSATLKTRIEELQAQIETLSGKTIIVKNDAGVAVMSMDAGNWPEAFGTIQADLGDTTAFIVVQGITGTRPGAVSGGGGGDEEGQIDAITWKYEIATGGLAGLAAIGLFGPTAGKGARENAEAWREKMKTVGNYPDFMSDGLRQVDALFNMDQQANQTAITEASFNPCECVLMFRELPSSVAGSWPDLLQSCDAVARMVANPPLDNESGEDPGYTLVFGGTITAKVEGSTSWNGSETKLSAQDTYQTLLDGAELLKADFMARYHKFQLTEIEEPTIDIDVVGGVCGFAYSFTTVDKVIAWEERTTLTNIARKIYDEVTDGSTIVHEQAGGDLRVLTHQMTVTSLFTPVAYKAPKLSKNWDQTQGSQDSDIDKRSNNGTPTWVTNGSRTWRWVQATPSSAGAGQRSSQSSFSKNTVGSGLI